MKRIMLFCFLISILSLPVKCFAALPEFSGGVNNEYEYKEYVFLSGVPVLFKGTYKITENDSKDKKTISYTFKLTPEDTSISGKLDRQMSYFVTYNKRNDKGQTISTTDLSKMKESIDLNGIKYDLKDYQFSKSDVIDNRPVSDFYSGNIKGRKYYTINKTEGTAVVDISGGDVGYQNFWGSTDTQKINSVITVDRKISGSTTGSTTTKISWQGTVSMLASDSTNKTMSYSDNDAAYSSIQGGYIRVINREMLSSCSYELPKMNNNIPDSSLRQKGEVELSNKMVPKLERLIVPKFKDVGGHWAADYINKLYSLDVFDDAEDFFLPEVSMTRSEFTKGVMRACNIRPIVDQKKTASKKKVQETSPFKDVATNASDYTYIKDAVQKGIITGISPELFRPEEALTRAQAVSILVRALGLQSMAPTPGFNTSFDDDSSIPSWAKDCVYVAKEVGLVTGDANNKFNPDKVLTRSEASAMLVRFLEFLQKDLQKDYREDILAFN